MISAYCGKAPSWQRISPPIILLIAGILGGLQVLIFPIDIPSITIQSVAEVVFLLVVVIGLFLIPSSRELTELSAVDAEAVCPPILLGLGLFTIRGLTDSLDEFLAHPTPTSPVLEDGTVVIGILLLLLGFIRWARIQEHQEGAPRYFSAGLSNGPYTVAIETEAERETIEWSISDGTVQSSSLSLQASAWSQFSAVSGSAFPNVL